MDNISGYEIIEVYENCIDEVPFFVDTENGNYRLSDNSPCINTGLTEGIDFNRVDLDGNPRVWNNVVDMGAYEYASVGINENAQTQSEIRIVGNPITVSSYAEIEVDEACNWFANVYSLDGKLLVANNLGTMKKGASRVEIGEMFTQFSSGTYLLVLRSANQVFVAKVIK